MSNITFDDLFAYRFQCQDTTNNEDIIIRKLKYYLYDNDFIVEDIDDFLFQFYIAFGHPITLEEIKLVEIDYDNNSEDELQVTNSLSHILFYSLLNNVYPTVNTEAETTEPVTNIITSTEPTINIPVAYTEAETTTIPVTYTEPETIPETAENVVPNQPINMNVFNIPVLISSNTVIETFINIFNNQNQMNTGQDIVVTTNEDEIDKIKKIEIDESSQDKCSICMSDLEKGDTILDIECKHKFHTECLTEYLIKYNHICPVCRQEIGTSKINY